MSRVGKSPVLLPEKVEVTISADLISVKGPLGTLSQAITSNVKVEKIDNQLEIKLNEDTRQANAISGTLRALIANMVQGVSKGFERKLMLVGVDRAVRDQLAKTGVLELIGDENVFVATPQLGEALNQAVAAATAWLGQPPGGAAPDKA